MIQCVVLHTVCSFITVANKADSQVTKKLKKEQPNLPFFSWSWSAIAVWPNKQDLRYFGAKFDLS